MYRKQKMIHSANLEVNEKILMKDIKRNKID